MKYITAACTLCTLGIVLTMSACHSAPADVLTALGTLEIVEVDVAPTSAGRVVRMLVDEGAVVHAGDTLAILAQPASTADIAGRASAVAAARATVREVERGPRAPELERARAELRTAQAEATRTADDVARLKPLVLKQIVSQQQFDAAVAAAKAAAGQRDAAQATVRLLQQGATPEEIDAAHAHLKTAQAALAATQAVAGDLVLTAPVSGVVTSRNAEPGEVLAMAQPAITIGDVTRPWVRVYVRERALPSIHIGDTVHAMIDGMSHHAFVGRVVAINPRAEYTPRVALTEDERADLMFGVRIAFSDSSGTLKAGLPVTVAFRPRPPRTTR